MGKEVMPFLAYDPARIINVSMACLQIDCVSMRYSSSPTATPTSETPV